MMEREIKTMTFRTRIRQAALQGRQMRDLCPRAWRVAMGGQRCHQPQAGHLAVRARSARILRRPWERGSAPDNGSVVTLGAEGR